MPALQADGLSLGLCCRLGTGDEMTALDPRMMYRDPANRPLNLTRGVFNLLTGRYYCREHQAADFGVRMMMECDKCKVIEPIDIEYIEKDACGCGGMFQPITYSDYLDKCEVERAKK
jgi:hypothetical protein